MESALQKASRIVVAIVLAAGMVLFGALIAVGGYGIVRRWSSISLAFAACGVLWLLAGPVMLAAGFWVLGSLGRRRIPLWAGGAAAVLTGVVLVVGVLTYVIPCSGPS